MFRRLLILLILAVILILGGYLFGYRWQPMEQLTRTHTRFIEAIEDKKWSRCTKLIAPDYGDRWALNRQDLSLALKDVGSQFFIVLDMNWETDDTKLAEDEESGTVSGRGSFSGKGSPLAGAIESYAARYADEVFTFHWTKQSWLPWDWKLKKIEHPSLSIPDGYKPGDLSRSESLF